MTWMRVAALALLAVAVAAFARGENSQGAAFIAVAVAFFAIGGQKTSRESD